MGFNVKEKKTYGNQQAEQNKPEVIINAGNIQNEKFLNCIWNKRTQKSVTYTSNKSITEILNGVGLKNEAIDISANTNNTKSANNTKNEGQNLWKKLQEAFQIAKHWFPELAKYFDMSKMNIADFDNDGQSWNDDASAVYYIDEDKIRVDKNSLNLQKSVEIANSLVHEFTHRKDSKEQPSIFNSGTYEYEYNAYLNSKKFVNRLAYNNQFELKRGEPIPDDSFGGWGYFFNKSDETLKKEIDRIYNGGSVN